MTQPRNLQATATLAPTGLFDTHYMVALTPATAGLGDDPNGEIVRSDTTVSLRRWR